MSGPIVGLSVRLTPSEDLQQRLIDHGLRPRLSSTPSWTSSAMVSAWRAARSRRVPRSRPHPAHVAGSSRSGPLTRMVSTSHCSHGSQSSRMSGMLRAPRPQPTGYGWRRLRCRRAPDPAPSCASVGPWAFTLSRCSVRWRHNSPRQSWRPGRAWRAPRRERSTWRRPGQTGPRWGSRSLSWRILKSTTGGAGLLAARRWSFEDPVNLRAVANRLAATFPTQRPPHLIDLVAALGDLPDLDAADRAFHGLHAAS